MKARVAGIIRSDIYEDDLEQKTFSNEEFSQLTFEDDGHEVEINGRMYDIVSIKSFNGKKIIYCLSDEKESNLKDWVKKNCPQKNNKLNNIFSKVFAPSKPVAPAIFTYQPKNNFLSSLPVENIFSIAYDVVTPPPRPV